MHLLNNQVRALLYGQAQDDLSFASTNATNSGIVVVASAGNSSDRPYIVGSPSSGFGYHAWNW
jgi:hypothetical protein